MAVTPARWLVDRSVLVRLDHGAVAEGVLLPLRAGQISVAWVAELEVGFSARLTRDDIATRDDVLDHLLPVALLVLPRSEPDSPSRTWPPRSTEC